MATTATTKRIMKERQTLANDSITNVEINVTDDNILKWSCSIKADASSPYKGGTFKFDLDLPENFPFKAPTITFKTKIYHPGFDEDGHICIPVLRDQWKPTVSLRSVLLTVQDKLNNPSPEDPFDPDIAAMLRDNKSKFMSTAKEWVKKYAQ